MSSSIMKTAPCHGKKRVWDKMRLLLKIAGAAVQLHVEHNFKDYDVR